MATRTGTRQRARRLAAVLFALGMHAALGAALLISVRQLVLPPEPPPLEVELVRPARPQATRREPVPPPPPPAPGRPLPARTPLIPQPRAPSLTPSVSPPVLAAPTAPAGRAAPPAVTGGRDDDVSGRVRDALRTSVGCDDDPLIGLSARERAACVRQRAQAAREARRPPPNARERALAGRPERRDAHKELRPDWDCAAGGSLGCRGSAVMVGGSIPFGYVPKALPPIPPSTLYGDDRIKKKPEPKP